MTSYAFERYQELHEGEAFYRLLSSRHVSRARKTHTCSVCRGTIAVGESYKQCAILGEEGFEIVRECGPCVYGGYD